MDKAGRKALLYTSSMLMFLSTLTLTIVSHTNSCPPSPTPPNVTLGFEQGSYGNPGASVIPLVSTMVFIFGEYLQHVIHVCLLHLCTLSQ